MRSTPLALTAITSCPNPGHYVDKEDSPAASTETDPTEPAPTTISNDSSTSRSLPKMSGLLVSSFNTVTLTPHVYVSFNIRVPSNTYTTMKHSHGFVASGLRDAAVADAFVKRQARLPPPSSSGDEMDRDDYSFDFDRNYYKDNSRWLDLVEPDGRLKPGHGGTWWMRCRLVRDKCVEVGDHVIVVAKALACGAYSGGKRIGLVYMEGEYQNVRVGALNMEKARMAKRERQRQQRSGHRRPSISLSGLNRGPGSLHLNLKET